MATLGALGIIIIGSLVVLICILLLIVRTIRRKKRVWIWYIVYVIGWAYTVAGIFLYVQPATSTDSTQPPSELITRDASELVLTPNDFKAGWIRLEAGALNEEDAQSAYHVYFRKGTGVTYCVPVVQNTVAVYPSINSAKMAYLGAKPTNISLKYPKIGDECFLNILYPENKLLVFRERNVVVSVRLQQCESCNVEPYAKIIEQRISGKESTSKVG